MVNRQLRAIKGVYLLRYINKALRAIYKAALLVYKTTLILVIKYKLEVLNTKAKVEEL